MRLLSKGKQFEKIKSGESKVDYRDAHITFVNEDGKDATIMKNIVGVKIINRSELPEDIDKTMFDDNKILVFEFEE